MIDARRLQLLRVIRHGQDTLSGGNKDETGQMNKPRPGSHASTPARVTRIMVIPTKKIAAAAGFNDPVLILRERGLRQLTQNVRRFFTAFRDLDLRDLDEAKVQRLLDLRERRNDCSGPAGSTLEYPIESQLPATVKAGSGRRGRVQVREAF